MTGREDVSDEISALLSELRSKLVLWQTFAGPAAGFTDDLAASAPDLIDRVGNLVQRGQIGYWLYAARQTRIIPTNRSRQRPGAIACLCYDNIAYRNKEPL